MPGSAKVVSPFHAGEQKVQARLGVRETMEQWGRKVIRSCMPDQHRDFYAQLPFVVAAARDELGQPWVTLLTGAPGFVRSPDPTTLVLQSETLPGDPLEQALQPGNPLGLLGIELETRRRNRVNGIVAVVEPGRTTLTVEHAFGNCPQYITQRAVCATGDRTADAEVKHHDALTSAMQTWISQADTFFIGSGHANTGNGVLESMDASHRGGPPGFVSLAGQRRLLFPDYAGNNHFNTIGNLVLDPRVGLLFLDFESGSLLQITGNASIDWHSSMIAEHPGAQRIVIVDIDEIVERRCVLPLRFAAPEGLVRELRVVEKQQESNDVTSFYLVPRDDGELHDFRAGQHLPLEFRLVGEDRAASRTYSLSNGPGRGYYRISVKREPLGLVSRFLHDSVSVGDIINSYTPAGDFVVRERDRPVVLISAGVGVTPMMSMLHNLTQRPTNQPIVFLHGVRNKAQHPFAKEIALIAKDHENVVVRTAYSQPRNEDAQGRDYDVAGRIDATLIRNTVQDLDADVFLCGPAPFLAAMTDILSELGIEDKRIHVEEF